MPNKLSALEPDTMYHIFGRSNGREVLFVNEGNYTRFLKLYEKYVSEVADTFCYCLMPNHYHFLIRIKSERYLVECLNNNHNISANLSKRFSNLLNSYSKGYNKQYKRHGSLFERPFKRKKVTSENYLKKLVHYIHYNPVKAEIVKQPAQYRFSSYQAILSGEPTLLNMDEVISWFGDRENFIHCHKSSMLSD